METLIQTYERLSSNLEEQLAGEVVVNPDDVLDDMIHHAERYRLWALLAAYADFYCKQCEAMRDRVLNDCLIAAREKLSTESDKKITEALVKQTAELMKVYVDAHDTYLVAYRAFKMFRAAEKVMESRKDMIQSLNSRQRQELVDLGISQSVELPMQREQQRTTDELRQEVYERRRQERGG
jgi:hypothetical protein